MLTGQPLNMGSAAERSTRPSTNLIPRDDHSDVVGSAAFEGQLDEAIARRRRVVCLTQDLGNSRIADGLAQTVGAEEQDIAVGDPEPVDLGLDSLARSADDV